MSDIPNSEYAQELDRVFPNGLNEEQTAYIGSLHNELAMLSQHLYDVQNNLAKWMLSQKATKEFAIQLGLKNGLKIDEIMSHILSFKINVLENSNNPSHGTNAIDSAFLNHMSAQLKHEIHAN